MQPQEIDPNTPLPEGMKEAAFLAITAWCAIYRDYDDPSMSPQNRTALYPMVLMNVRWDGRIGFVGGFVEKGHTLRHTVVKEALEEVAVAIAPDFETPHVVSHQTDRIRVHAFEAYYGVVPLSTLLYILAGASHSDHAVAEGCAVWVHLADYGRGKGFDTLLKSPLATAVAEELVAIRTRMYANAPPGAYMGPDAK